LGAYCSLGDTVVWDIGGYCSLGDAVRCSSWSQLWRELATSLLNEDAPALQPIVERLSALVVDEVEVDAKPWSDAQKAVVDAATK